MEVVASENCVENNIGFFVYIHFFSDKEILEGIHLCYCLLLFRCVYCTNILSFHFYISFNYFHCFIIFILNLGRVTLTFLYYDIMTTKFIVKISKETLLRIKIFFIRNYLFIYIVNGVRCLQISSMATVTLSGVGYVQISRMFPFTLVIFEMTVKLNHLLNELCESTFRFDIIFSSIYLFNVSFLVIRDEQYEFFSDFHEKFKYLHSSFSYVYTIMAANELNELLKREWG